jgi:hypothetical protein
MMLSAGGWALFTGLEAASVLIPEKIIWAKMQFICIALLSAFWLLFVLQYTHQAKRISTWWVISLMVIPVLTVYITITEERYHWLWERIVPSSTIPGAPLIYTNAWWFIIFAVYFYLLIIIGALVLIRKTLILQKLKGRGVITAKRRPAPFGWQSHLPDRIVSGCKFNHLIYGRSCGDWADLLLGNFLFPIP